MTDFTSQQQLHKFNRELELWKELEIFRNQIIFTSLATSFKIPEIRIKGTIQADLMSRWRLRSWPRENVCTTTNKVEYQSTITLADMQGSFYILGIGKVDSTQPWNFFQSENLLYWR